MWQDFKDFITIDNLHIFCFWFLIILTVVGLIEIIYQIRNAVRKINIADEYIKHIDIIQKHVAKRLHARKQYGFVDTKDAPVAGKESKLPSRCQPPFLQVHRM